MYHGPKPLSLLTIIVSLAVLASVGCSSDETMLPPLPVAPDAITRGASLVEGIAACGFCHSLNGKPGQPLSGGRTLVDSDGEVQAPNITLAKSGLRGWKESDVVHALRQNEKPDGSTIARTAHLGFEWLSDGDLSGVIAYLRTLPPVEHEIPSRSGDPLALGLFKGTRAVKGLVPSVEPRFPAAYGQYLADHVARCASCHNTPAGIIGGEEYWAGGIEVSFDGEYKTAPNITSSKTSGIGTWSEKAITNFITTGRAPDGHLVDPRFCPTEFFRRGSESDIAALVTYIRSVPPID